MPLKNRLIMAPIASNLAAEDGTVSEELLFHYAERARGGVGLIIVENVCITYPLPRQMRCTGQRFAIIGGGMLGLETAKYLAAQGNSVAVLKRYQTIGRGIEPLYCNCLLRELEEHGVEIVARVEVEAIHADGVLVRDDAGGKRVVPADQVVLARGAKPSSELEQAVQDLDPIVVGDAVQPRKIVHAIAEGYLAARAIGRGQGRKEG